MSVALTGERDTGTTTKIWTTSGDSHFTEPYDIWGDYMPARLAEQMPRSVRSEDGREETVYVDGQVIRRRVPKPLPAGKYKVGDYDLEIGEGHSNGGLMAIAERPPGALDPRARLVDMDKEGVWAECVYPSLAVWSTYIRTPELAKAGARAINDWVVDNVMGVTDRLVPAFSISSVEPSDAVEELQRCADLGFKVMQMPVEPADNRPRNAEGLDTRMETIAGNWNDTRWEPLWAAAEEANIVVGVHVGSDRKPMRVKDPGGALFNYVDTTYGGQRFVTMIVSSGVLDRHPNLKVLVSEGGAAWAPFIGDRMNEAYRQHWFYVRPQLSMLPKEFIYRQVYVSFQHDETAIPAVTGMGYRNVLFGWDYPHAEGTFGHTQEILHRLFDGVDEDTKHRVTIGAFRELFPHVGEPPADLVASRR